MSEENTNKNKELLSIESEELLATCGKGTPGFVMEDSNSFNEGFKEVRYSASAPDNFRRLVYRDNNGNPIAAALISHAKTSEAKVEKIFIKDGANNSYIGNLLYGSVQDNGATIKPQQITKDTYLAISPIMTGGGERLREDWLNAFSKGKPGLTKIEPSAEKSIFPENKLLFLIYRDSNGNPVGAAEINNPNTNEATVQALYLKKVGLLSGRAANILLDEIEKAGATENLPPQMSKYSAGIYHHYQIKKALERGEHVPEEVLKDYPALYKKAAAAEILPTEAAKKQKLERVVSNMEIDKEMEKFFPGGVEEWDKKYKGLKMTGDPRKDILNFYIKVITSREIGYDTPYKSIKNYLDDTDKNTGIGFIRPGIRLDYFLKLYPDYPKDDLLESLESDSALSLFRKEGKIYVTISNETMGNFIYRGEDVGPQSLNKINIFELFDNYINKNQKAIGYQGGVSTAISPLVSSTQFLSPNGGLWIIDKKNAMEELKNDGGVSNTGETLLVFQEHIPFKYVKNFITSNEIRNQLLDRYGSENTQLFNGRPLKEVIIGLDITPQNYSDETLKKIIELNLTEEQKRRNSRKEISKDTTAPEITTEPQNQPVIRATMTNPQEIKNYREKIPETPTELGVAQPQATVSSSIQDKKYREEVPEGFAKITEPKIIQPKGIVGQNNTKYREKLPENSEQEQVESNIAVPDEEKIPGFLGNNWEREIMGDNPEKKSQEQGEGTEKNEGEEDNRIDNNNSDETFLPQLPSEDQMESQIEEAGEREKVSPADPDFILILIFALLVDALDIILEITGILIIPKLIGMVIDFIVLAIIGKWMAWRTGKIANAKKEQQLQNEKLLQQQLQKMQKLQKAGNMSQESFNRYMKQYGQRMGKSTQTAMRLARSPLGRRVLKTGLVLVAELIPLVGIMPWWTITVVSTLKEK